MKTWLAVVSLALAGAAQAEEFTLAANGPAVNLLLRGGPAASAPAVQAAPVVEDAHASALCYTRAKRELAELTPFAASQLCGGAADSAAPVDCYLGSRRTDLTTIGRVTLCAAATDAEAPTACYERSAKTELGGFLRAQLCAAAVTAEGPVACWKASRPQPDLPVIGRVKLCTRR